MGRKSAVTPQVFVETILLYDDLIQNGEIQKKNEAVWTAISVGLHHKMTYNNVWTAFRRNQWKSLETYCKEKEIPVPDLQAHNIIVQPQISSSTSDESLSPGNIAQLPAETFIVTIDPEDWSRIKPVRKIYYRRERNAARTRLVLQHDAWKQCVIDGLWKQHRIPCPYTFKRSYVYNEPSRLVFIKISAYCTECGATAEGTILDEPFEGESVALKWRAPNTVGRQHTKNRPVRGEKRKDVSRELQGMSAAVYRTAKSRELIDFGDSSPPNVASSEMYRKIKQLEKYAQLQIPKEQHPVLTLRLMKYHPLYAGQIHDIGLDKFSVHYYTPEQMVIFRQYCAKNKQAVVAFDATGTLVQKLDCLHSGQSGHIFLYEGVINVEHYQIPVVQMLSEKHDANSILYWLNEWERKVTTMPSEVVCDASPALLSALARAFARCASLKDYVDQCFKALSHDGSALPPCFIRIDVARLIKSSKNWDILNKKESRLVKDFYLRCVGLLVLSDTLGGFEEILSDVLVVALSKTMGTVKEEALEVKTPSLLSRDRLLSKIASIGVEAKALEMSEESLDPARDAETRLPDVESFGVDDSEKAAPRSNDEAFCLENAKSAPRSDADVSSLDSSGLRSMKEWALDIKAKAVELSSQVQCDNPSSYYSEDIADRFILISQNGVLWSGLMVSLFRSPRKTGSSASVEGDFAHLKTRILAGESPALSIPVFVATHLHYIEGAFKLAEAELKAGSFRDADSPETQTPDVHKSTVQHLQFPKEGFDDILVKAESGSGQFPKGNVDGILVNEEVESSRGSGQSPKENINGIGIKEEVASSRDSEHVNVLLKNGNDTPFYKVKDIMTRVVNTCPFDSAAQGLCYAYTENSNYRAFVEEAAGQIPFLKFVRTLALHGAVKDTYVMRIDVLSPILPVVMSAKIPTRLNPSGRSERPDVVTYECFANIGEILKKLLKEAPSITTIYSCVSCHEEDIAHTIVIEPPLQKILIDGITILEEAINDGITDPTNYIICKKCRQRAEMSSIEVWPHLIVDIEVLSSMHPDYSIQLDELQPYISVVGAKLQLLGVVANIPGHYISYCRRTDGTWDYYNDLLSSAVMNVQKKTAVTVTPHILIYALCKEQVT